MTDIFDQLARDFPQQEGDIFDQIASDSDESASARGASSISAPRSPVAAQNATSAAANPAPGATAFAPQHSLQGQKTGTPLFGPLVAPSGATPNVAPATQARQKPPVHRAPARQVIKLAQTVASPVQQQRPAIQHPQTPLQTQQAPASAPNSRSMQPNGRSTVKHPEYAARYKGTLNVLSPEEKRKIGNQRTSANPGKQKIAQRGARTTAQIPSPAAKNDGLLREPNWRYIVEHPQYPEYREFYLNAFNHLSPEERREILNKRVAAYPENQPEELEPIFDPATGVQMGMSDVGPKAQAAMEQHSLVPQWIMPALAFGQRYLVTPFDKATGAGAKAGKNIVLDTLSGANGVPEAGIPGLLTEEEREQARKAFTEAHPRIAGVAGAVGAVAGGTVADPRMWPFFFAGPEVAGGRFLSRATSSTLSRAASAGFATQMGVGSVQQAAQIREIWGRPDISLDEKYEAITELVLNATMAALGTRSVIRGARAPKPLAAQFASEINALGPEAKQHIFSMLDQKFKEQEALRNQTAPSPSPRTPVPKPAARKRNITAASQPRVPIAETAPKSADTISAQPTQLAAIANRSDIPSAQKHELMAKAILGELMPQTEAAAPAQAHAHAAEPADTHAADDPVAAMKRYMEANGELPPRAESKAPPPQLALDPEKIAPIGRDLAQLPHADRQGVLINLHDKLSHVIFEQGKILGPDGQLHVVSSPAEAAKLAQQIINDSIKEHDQHIAQNQNTRIIPSQTPPLLPAVAATPETRAQSGIRAERIPEMGHGMTADSPAVRRVKAEARPVRGQEPTVKVKQEPPAAQAALTQPPAPVTPEAASRIGQRDPQSGRTILQPSNNLIQNERLANQAAPELETRLSRITDSVPGAKFDRLRPQKGLERLQDKVADGKPPRTIGDNLAAQIVAPNVEAKNQLIARMRQEFPVLSVDDKFTEPRDKAGYPSTNVQVQMPNGGTAEVQIVTPEVQAKTDQTHRLYTLGRGFPEGSPERAHYWDQAAAIHAQALEKFKAREARESQGRSQQTATAGQQPGGLVQGQRVVLKNGQTGKIVDRKDRS